VPLTIAMMNNPASIYYANPVNPSGAILSSSSVATVLKATDPVHGPILTGAVDLPISQIQIAPSFGVPGPVAAFRKGDHSLGTPLFHLVLTNLYTFDHGWAKGIEVGGSVNEQYKNLAYYYLANGFNSANPTRLPFYAPNFVTVDPILGYSHRFRHVTFETQLNVSNIFNHYEVVIIPSQSTGYSTVTNLSAAFFGQPRGFAWTNRISF
jgi:hypothetical protein